MHNFLSFFFNLFLFISPFFSFVFFVSFVVFLILFLVSYVNRKKLKNKLNDIESYLTPEIKEAADIQKYKKQLENEIELLKKQKEQSESDLNTITNNIQNARAEILDISDKLLFESFSLYEPKYNFGTSEKYKNKLDTIIAKQKQIIKDGKAIDGAVDWSINGNKSEGVRFIKDMQKLLLRAFNNECENIIQRVTYANYEQSEKRITNSFESVSKLGHRMQISISKEYYSLKIEELQLSFEYKQMLQNEKEEQRELKAQMREEAKVQKELEEARKVVQKEQTHYTNALLSLLKQLETANEEEKQAIFEKKNEIESHLAELDVRLHDIDYKEANIKVGYVYIISNIGAFGENVYKIGMTRREIPTERIDELGDASVPFKFDIHALIFSEDAPALEAKLHKAFENKKTNLINPRKEFFNVTLDEIKEEVKKNHDKTVEFFDIPSAEQYRQSERMRKI